MRSWLALALVACGGPAPPVATPAAAPRSFTCDTATWDAYAQAEQHGRLAASGRAVNIAEVDHDDVLLASVVDGVVVARWAPATTLGAVTTEEVLLSPAPGAPGDRAIRVRPGAPVAATGSDDVEFHARGRVHVDGFVPARVRGRVWTGRPKLGWARSHGDYVVRAAPDASAPIRAELHDGFMRLRGGTATWLEVTAGDDTVEVDGFIERPPPAEQKVYDGAEVEQISHVERGTCLLDAPDGAAVGMVVGFVSEPPRVAREGWQALRVDTAWGARDYFFPTPPPETPESGWPWPYTGESW